MLVRLARPSEHTVLGEITVAAYAPFTLGAADPYVERLRDAGTRAEQAELWAVEDDGLLLGSVTWCPRGSPWTELATDGEGEFRMLAVDPAARGRGAGRALVAHCVGLSRAAGHHGMVLSSLAEMTEAHRLYERFGFVRDPARDWSPLPGVDLQAFTLSH